MVNGHKSDVIHVNHPTHAGLIARRLQKPYDPTFDSCISRTLGDELLGGALYQHYNGTAIAMHVASVTPRWLTRNALFLAFHYPFEQLKVQKIVGVVPATNVHAWKFDLGLGFVEEARLQGIVPEGDAVILSMRRDQCRWLNWNPRGLVIVQHAEHHQHEQPVTSSTGTGLQQYH